MYTYQQTEREPLNVKLCTEKLAQNCLVLIFAQCDIAASDNTLQAREQLLMDAVLLSYVHNSTVPLRLPRNTTEYDKVQHV